MRLDGLSTTMMMILMDVVVDAVLLRWFLVFVGMKMSENGGNCRKLWKCRGIESGLTPVGMKK